MKRKILVTGATGFVGGHLMPKLLAQGEDVRVLVRDPDGLDPRFRHRVEVFEGTLEHDGDLKKAVDGCGKVLHLAALARACPKDPADYSRINARAVEVLLEAAARSGVERVVHVSSVAALPPTRFAKYRGISQRPTKYGLSKTASEALVHQYVAEGHHAVIVRPSRVYGPGPWTDANGTTRLMALYLSGKLRVRLADGGVEANYVHVDDVARGIVLASRLGQSGMAYNLGGQDASLTEYFAAITAATGIKRTVVPIPPQALLPFAHFCAWWGRCGGRVNITPGWLNNFLEHRPMDITASREDLGYEPQTLAEGVASTLAWLQKQEGGDRCVTSAIRCLRQAGV
jgi:nucleoside-diphosphate-sugar epimerase